MLDVVNVISPLTSQERARLVEEVGEAPHLAALHVQLEEATAGVTEKFARITLFDLVGRREEASGEGGAEDEEDDPAGGEPLDMEEAIPASAVLA